MIFVFLKLLGRPGAIWSPGPLSNALPGLFFINFRQNLDQLLTNVEPSVHWLCCKTTNNSHKLVCRPPISNAYDHWLFLAFLNAQYNWLLQWLLPLKSVYLRKSSTQWAIDFCSLEKCSCAKSINAQYNCLFGGKDSTCEIHRRIIQVLLSVQNFAFAKPSHAHCLCLRPMKGFQMR